VASRNHYLDHSRAHLVRQIGHAILHRLRDPRIPMIVSVTDLKLATDTRDATVYVSVFGSEEEQTAALEALNHAAPYIQKIVAGQVRMRHFPHLTFRLDHSIERGAHIEQLLREIKDDLA
jgi:ribosome-binding factor A